MSLLFKCFPVYILFIALSNACAQDSLLVPLQTSEVPDSAFIVDNIILTGNTHTKDFVILREMTLKHGAPITQRLLEYDKNRIYSLGLFNQVELRIAPSRESLATVMVAVYERWYIFPYPIFGFRDRDWSKVYFGVGILHENFRGRNEKVFFNLVFGYDPSARFTYRNPFLSEDGNNFFEVSAGFSKVRNRSLEAQNGTDNFDEHHYSGSLTWGKRFGLPHTLGLTMGYEIVDVSDVVPVKTLSPDGIDKFPIFSVAYAYDTRDVREYATHGTYIRASATKYGFPGHDVDVVRYTGDIRKYIPLIENFVLTARTFTNLAGGGIIPSYNRVYFGYGDRIRGHFKEVMEGEQIFGISSELHYPILSPIYFKVGILPTEFSVWRFGITAAVYGDAGTVWFRGEPFALNQFSKGYGIGLDFLLPYSAVVRLEYAWNEVRRGEFIFDIGAAF